MSGFVGGLRAEIVQVLGFVQVGVFKLVIQVCAFKLGCSGRGVL
jgi:hypothetical protein